MKTLVKNFVKNESGATAIEYSLLAAVVATGIIAVGANFKADLNSAFSNIGAKIKSNTK